MSDDLHRNEAVPSELDMLTLFDVSAAVRRTLENLRASGFDLAWVAEPSDSGILSVRSVAGARSSVLDRLAVPEGTGLTGKVHSSLRPEWVDDYQSALGITHNFDWHMIVEGISGLLAVPLQRPSGLPGVIAVGTRAPGGFGDRAVDEVVGAAHRASLAISVAERARLSREVAVHEERRRLAESLHDSVGAALYAIGAGVARLAESAHAVDSPDAEELAAKLTELHKRAGDASTALRASLRALHASPAELALGVQLRADARAFTERSGVPAEVIFLEEPPALSPARTATLVAGVREALLNVEKHADAAAVAVTVSRRPDGVVVAVTDDGTGIEPRPAGEPAPAGLGLRSSEEAVARLGGTLRVLREPMGGTTWRVFLPC